ncbi:MAG: LacI family DNA-binding transcriptional regulator [Victivallales bacterium]|nr:LacI family DNA-binding transcriptional regulator [Victivallales bacterium]
MQQIAELCGVSAMTVSRVFNTEKAEMVKESTRKKILAVAKKYDYHPVIIGKSFLTGKTYKVGLILDTMSVDLSSPAFSRFVEAACGELQSRNYSLVLLLAKDVKRHGGENVRELLESKVADGYILGKSMVFESLQDILRKTPVLLLSSEETQVSESSEYVQIYRPVLTACRTVWEMIPRELRRSVAVVAPDNRFYSQRSRADLIASAAPKGAKATNFYSSLRPGFLVDRENAAVVAEERFDELRNFKVIWGISDLYAMGVMDVFRRHGLVAGRDFHVVGFDNLEPAMPKVKPFLTTCDWRWEEIGRLAAATVLQMIAGEKIPGNALPVEPVVVRRASL